MAASSAVGVLPRTAFSADATPSSGLLKLFQRLDDLSHLKAERLTLVEFTISVAGRPERRRSEKAWVVQQDDNSISVIKNDLLPWTYSKTTSTMVPSSWKPTVEKFEAAKEIDLPGFLKEWSIPEKPDDESRLRRRLSERSGPSYRLLLAYMAWKHGFPQYCQPIIEAASDTPEFKSDFDKYQENVLTDLAWLHYWRAVNLLMFADRREVLPHLKLASALSPESEYAAQAKDLLAHLEKMIAIAPEASKQLPSGQSTTDEQRAQFYVSQLRDLNCPQFAQPGFINPYMMMVDGQPDENPPTVHLKAMGMKAVPFLIAALDDDTPTRTVYHWRDFAHSRLVWRVSDFAWHVLRDITKKEFGYQRVIGFTLGAMNPSQKESAIADIKKWYAENKDRSEDDQMFSFFASKESDDWLTAGEHFLKLKNNRAVEPLVTLIPTADSFAKGDLCELLGKFRDQRAATVLKSVMVSAPEHSDRLGAAIGLWYMGDQSGIPIVIDYIKATDQPYGSWDEPIWFLMTTRSKKGIDALQSVILDGPVDRASEVLGFITQAISGDLHSERRDPAGCVEIAAALFAAMSRSDETGGTYNDAEVRIKDQAAVAFVLLRDGTDDPFPGNYPSIDSKQFDISATMASDRDRQIETLKQWYTQNKDRLIWDVAKKRLAVRSVN